MAVGKTDAAAARLKGARVLLVEDDGNFAPDLLELVQAFGCRVAGWAPRLPEAFALSATRDFDLALLDLNIGGHSVRPFAAHVRQKGKPMCSSPAVATCSRMRMRRSSTSPLSPMNCNAP